MKKKVVGICGSTRKNGTDFAVQHALNILDKEYDCETFYYTVRGKKINPCIHCNLCIKKELTYCPVYEDDDMMPLYEKVFNADVILLGSPVFEMGMTPQLSAVLSRFRPNYILMRDNPNAFYDKLGAAIAVGGTRNGGQEIAITSMHGFFHTNGILPVGASLGIYAGASIWSQDKVPFDESVDPQGIKNLEVLARKVGETLKLIKK